MAQLSDAERFLIDAIRGGDPTGWTQLVERYQGRLLAFARSRLKRGVEADDLVQDTFVSFLTALKTFDTNYSLETFLFTILRRKLIDHFRGRAARVCFLNDLGQHGGDDEPSEPPVEDDGFTASRYAVSAESQDKHRRALSDALEELLERLRVAENFRDLKIVEMLFYAHVRNKDAARLLDMDEKQIALIKHRCVKEVRENVARRLNERVDGDDELDANAASMLSEIWERQRLTCPKRTTVGRLMLGTLESPWKEYVDFHVNTLGCSFCKANLDDLVRETTHQPRRLEDRVMQSTIGFFRDGRRPV